VHIYKNHRAPGGAFGLYARFNADWDAAHAGVPHHSDTKV